MSPKKPLPPECPICRSGSIQKEPAGIHYERLKCGECGYVWHSLIGRLTQ